MLGELIQDEDRGQQNHEGHEHRADHVWHKAEGAMTEARAESDLH